MKVLFLIFIVVMPLIGNTQINFFSSAYDSLKSDYRIGGSMHNLEESTQLFDASFLLLNGRSSYLSLSALNPNGAKIHSFGKSKRVKLISPLPHIGFSYFFGTQGAQKLEFEYQQVFKGDWVLNTAISNIKSGGFFRNTSFGHTDLDFSLSKKKDDYGISLKGRTSKVSREWSGGVIDASLLESFDPLLVPVNKSSCTSVLKYFETDLLAYVNLVKREDYTIGVMHEVRVDGENRVFTEQDTLNGLYSNLYFDSLNTRDEYQHSRLINTSLAFFKNSSLSYSAGASVVYWNYRNMNLYRDTLELDLVQQLEFSKGKFDWIHNSKLNTIGASKSWYFDNQLRYRAGEITVQFKSELGQKLPEVYQRFYSANNIFYSNIDLELQTYSKQALELVFKKPKYTVTPGYVLQANRGVYFYDLTKLNWSNESTLSSNLTQQVYLKSIFKHKSFRWRQVYRLSLTNTERLIVPLHQLEGSIMASAGLFKAKKLRGTFGLTYHLNSKTSIIPLIENMGQYHLLEVSASDTQKGLFNLGAMVAMEIETFRFFVKLSNIGYLWNSTNWQYIDGIYLSESTVRVGLTWDFWN